MKNLIEWLFPTWRSGERFPDRAFVVGKYMSIFGPRKFYRGIYLIVGKVPLSRGDVPGEASFGTYKNVRRRWYARVLFYKFGIHYDTLVSIHPDDRVEENLHEIGPEI